MGDNVIPMKYVCRDCTPSSSCTKCEWLGKLLDQEIPLHEIAETRLEE